MECFKIDEISNFVIPSNLNLCEIPNYFDEFSYCTSLVSQAYLQNENKETLKNYVSNLLLNYFEQHPFNSEVFSNERTQLADLCAATNFPNLQGICDTFLDISCEKCTREDIRYSTDLKRFCGCRVSESKTLSISIECDAMCNRPGITARKENQECVETICVLDSINITSVNSQINGGTIEQLCGNNCSKENPCQCFIDLTVINSIKNNNLAFHEYCGPANICYVYDSQSGDATPVLCTELNSSLSSSSSENSSEKNLTFLDKLKSINVFIAFILVVFIVFSIILLISIVLNLKKA